MGSAYMHGWISLPSACDMLLENGVPVAVRAHGKQAVDMERLVDDIAAVSGLHVTVGPWRTSDAAEDMKATLHVDAQEIDEVLRRLAQASAAVFYDRYHKPIDATDTDFDDEAYAYDFGCAMEVCGLHWNQTDERGLRQDYLRRLHQAAAEMARQPH